MTRQEQSGGDFSTNLQAAGPITIHQSGLTVNDATEMVLALVRPELDRLEGQAATVAYERVEEMVNQRLIPRLMQMNPDGLGTFADPDVQYALLSAQRTYARSGDPDVADVLVDILVDRTKQTERDVLQLALNESLEVAAKLTVDQYAALSLIWMIKSTRNNGVFNLDGLRTYVDTHLAPHVPLIRTSNATFQHLEYAGCGSVGLNTLTVENCLRQNYPGLFAKGLTPEQLDEAFGGSIPNEVIQFLVSCLNEPSLRQVIPLGEDAIRQMAEHQHVSDSSITTLISLSKRNLMSDIEIRPLLESLNPAMGALLDKWTGSFMKNMTLTSVGIVIAHANCRRIMGSSPADLSIWIN